MADEQIVTSIVAKADLSSLVSEVHRATASLQQLQRELITSNKSIASATKVANNLFRDSLIGSGMYSSHFVNLQSDVDKFGKNLDAGRLKLKDYFSTFRTHMRTSKGLIRELAQEQVMLQNAVMQPLGRNAQGLMQYNVMIPRGLDLTKNKIQLARMEMQIMNKALSEGATSLINWGKNTQWAGRQLTVGLTVPLAMFGSQAAKAFREADQELTRLVKVYGDLSGSTSKDLAQIRKDVTQTAKELSSTMGVSFKETIGLAADIAATGQQGQQLLGSLQETTRLAVLGEVDRAEAMKATLAIQTAFKSNTQELTESINFLNAVENQTSTTLNDLVEAIPKAGTVVKQLGGDVQDLALYLTAMREGGVNASEAANALKSGLASMINPTKQTIGVMSDFGIDIMGMVQRNTGNTTGMIMELQRALDGLDPLSKARALEQMFGKFQFARMAALFNNLGKEGSQTLQVMELMNASASQLANIASRELSMVTESASGKYRRAIEGLRASLADVGEEFLGVATKFLNAFTKVLDFFNNLPEPIKKAVTYLGGFTAVIGPIIMLTGVLANFFGYITKGIVQLRAFFQRAHGWKMLTPEIIAAEKASQMVEKAFYSDAKAAEVLHGALTKLVSDYMNLQKAMLTGSVPVNPAVNTVGGSTVINPLRRVVNPNDPYAGEINTRAMSHINPRDPNNPASIFGGVPGAVPVNRGILRTPQIFMQDRLPNIEGLTSVKGISTGIVAGEAARFHALMATLGMQTEAEVANLKKTIALGGTVSAELLDTFDDILPITTRLADNAATQSARIVSELRAGKMTVDAAKTEIMAINAQLEASLKSEVAAYAAVRGRTIDFTKAPLMNQPVVDATGQFTLRDLYKKEANRAVMEEFGRLRGIRTFGAPYSIQTTRFPKLNSGGQVESFGPNKTQVSGPTSINYDDRLGSVPLGGYVLNQQASMDPANASLVAMAPYTYENGGEITAALTPGEIVFGPKIQRDPMLYAAVDAANNGYNFGGQIMRGIGNYGAWDDYRSRAAIAERYDVSSNWTEEAKFRMKINAASALVSVGVDPKEAVKMAHEDVEEAYTKSTSKTSGRVSRAKFKQEALRIIKERQRKLTGLGIQNRLLGVGSGTMNLHASQIDSGSINLLKELTGDKNIVSNLRAGEVDRIYKSIFGITTDNLNNLEEKSLLAMLRDKSNNKFASEHMSPRDIKGKTSSSGAWGYNARGNYLQAMAGESDINWMHAQLGDVRKRKLWGNFVAFDSPHAKSLVDWAAKTSGVGNMQELRQSLKRGAVGNKSFLKFLSLIRNPRFNLMPRASFVDARLNSGGAVPGGSIRHGRYGYGLNPMSLLTPEKMLNVLRTSKELSSKAALGEFANMSPASYSHQIMPSSGKSYPIPGVSGIYKNDKGDLVFFKGVPNEITAKAEMYGTRMAREVFGLDSPNQTVRTILNPFDPARKSKLLGLESPFDSRFSAGGTKFTEDQMIRQTVASLLMGNKDLSKSNVFGNVLADVGPAGVFPRASMNTAFAESMNSMEKQAMINLLAVRGGARKDFAHNTSSIAAGMSPRQYGAKMKSAMKKMHPKLQSFINSLPESDRAPYIAMLARLEDGMNVNWSKYQSIHANPAFNKGGGVISRNRSSYGNRKPAGFREGEMGTGRTARRRGTFGVYNPGNVMFDRIADPLETAMLQARAGLMTYGSQLKDSGIMIAETSKAMAIQTRAGLMAYVAQTKSAATTLASTGRYIGLRTRILMDNMSTKLNPLRLEAYQQHREAGTLQTHYKPGMITGPIGLTPWQQQSLQDGRQLESRKLGYYGFRKTEYRLDGQNISRAEAQRQGLVAPRGSIGYGGQMAMGMAGMAAGSALMSQGKTGLGMGLMMGSSIIPMMMPQIIAALTKLKMSMIAVASVFKAGTFSVNTFVTALTKIKSAGPLIIITAIITALGILIKKTREWNRDAQLRFGMNAKSAEEAGIKYTSLADKMKLVAQRQASLQNVGRGGGSLSGIAGLNMSMQELKEAKEYAKENLGSFVDSFNRADAENIAELATNIKAQFIAAGMSVEEANKKIMGMISASKNANLAVKVLSDRSFTSVRDASSAAEYSVKSLSGVITAGSTEVEQYDTKIIEGISSVIDLTDKAIVSTSQQKDAVGNLKGEYKALLETTNKLKSIKGFNQEIGVDAYNALPAELSAISSKSDTIAGIYAKWRLYLKGVKVDLQAISSTTAEAIDKYLTAFTAAQDSLVEEGKSAFKNNLGADKLDGTFRKVGFTMASLQNIIDQTGREAALAQQKASRSVEDQNEKLQKQIDLIQKAADEKLKALDATQSRENYEIELQKSRLDYQAAVARGDFAAAERARLNLQQLQKTRQVEQAKLAIQEDANAQQEKIRKQQEALAKEEKKRQRAFQDAQNEAARAQEAMNKIASFSSQYKDLLLQKQTNQFITNASEKRLADNQTNNQLQALVLQIQQAATVQKGKPGYDLAADIKKAFSQFFDPVTGKALKFDATTQTPTYSTTSGLSLTSNTVKGQMSNVLDADMKTVRAQALLITGGMTIKELAASIKKDLGQWKDDKDDPDTITPGKSDSTSIATITAESGQQASGKAMGLAKDKKTKIFTAESGMTFAVFNYKGKTYATALNGSGIYKYDTNKNVLGELVQARNMNSGGQVFGPGTGTSDSIPTMLSNGEYVINAKSAQNVGYGFLNSINNMAMGGIVGNVSMPKYNLGGMLARSQRLNMANGGHVGNVIIDLDIHASPGMDERALARAAAREVFAAINDKKLQMGSGKMSQLNRMVI